MLQQKKGWGKNVIVMYTCKDNLTPLLYSGKIKKIIVCAFGVKSKTPLCMEYYSAIKKNDLMPFAATWMELENLILSEMSQKDKDKYHMISLITGI